MALCKDNLTQAFIHTDRLTHNLGVLQRLVGSRPLWPAIKANAYGHGIDIGRQGEEEVTADELADLLGTINYEVVTAISQRVPRIVISG